MITEHTLLSFFLTCLIIELTPGPNITYLAILSLSDGRKAGFSAVGGVALGLFMAGLITSAGIATIIINSSILYQLLRWSGVIYLLYLAWSTWKDEKDLSAATTNQKDVMFTFFIRGLVTNLLNPKAFIFYIAILPQFLVLERPVFSQTLKLTIIYVVLATTIHCGIVMLAAHIRHFFDHPSRMQRMRQILSILLAVVAVWIAIETQHLVK